FVVDVDFEAREPRDALQLTRGDFNHSAPVRWSPDGSRIAFASARHTSRERDNASDLWVMDVPATGTRRPTGSPRRLTRTLGPVSAPAWSPDGNEVAYLGHAYRKQSSGRHHHLWTVRAEGSDPACLTTGL